MNLPPVVHLVAGELRHHLRDRVTIAVMVLGQGLVFPLVGLGLARLQVAGQAQVEAAEVTIAVEGDVARVAPYATPHTHLVRAPSEKADATITLSPPGEPYAAEVRFRGESRNGMNARRRAADLAEEAGKAERRASFLAKGAQDPDALVVMKAEDTISDADRALRRAASIAPALLMMLVASGGIYTALDVVTGDRERGTIETLLSTAANRRDIAAAKFLTVLVLVLMASFVSLSSMWATARTPMGVTLAGGAVLPASAYGTALLLFLPLAATVAAILTAAAARVSDFKSGQVYALPALILPVGLAAIAMVPEATLSPLVALIPVTNLSVALKEVLLGQASPGVLALALVASTAYAAGGLVVTTRWLGREEVLLGDRGGRHRRLRGDYGPDALAVFAIGLTLVWFVASPAQKFDFTWGMILTQAGLLAPLALSAPWFLGLPVREVLGLRAPRAIDVFWGLLAGALCPTVGLTVAFIQERLLPTAPASLEALAGAVPDLSLPVLLGLLAFAPAVCEELLFRGAILGLAGRNYLQGSSRAWTVGAIAVLQTALAFGLFHLSLFRVVPTAVLGVLFGVARLRSRSLLVPMLMHVMNNGLLVGSGALGVELAFSPWMLLGVAGMGVFLTRMGR